MYPQYRMRELLLFQLRNGIVAGGHRERDRNYDEHVGCKSVLEVDLAIRDPSAYET